MKTIADLMFELTQAVDLYKFYEMQSSFYTLERVDELCEEIERLSTEKKVLKRVSSLRKEAHAYYPEPSALELSCAAASRAMMNPHVSKVIL